jgi:hypothetical protein
MEPPIMEYSWDLNRISILMVEHVLMGLFMGLCIFMGMNGITNYLYPLVN